MQRSKKQLIGVAAAATLVATAGVGAPISTAQAASGKLIVQKWRNDYSNKRCSTSLVWLYNASNAPVKSVSLLYKGDTISGRWRFITKGKASKSWRTYSVYIAPGETYKLRKWVCASWRNTGGEYSFENSMAVKPVRYDWSWY